MMLKRLGEKIRTLRRRRGMSQIQMGQQLGYADGSYISEVESGKKNPTAEFIFKVSQLFNVLADVLLDDRLELPE